MNLDKLEIWVHDYILKNEKIRHFCYGLYQRVLYLVSPKFKYEGNITAVTPDDEYEYLFGYYDKCPWSNDGRYLLALKVKDASSKADSTVPAEIVSIDLENNNACETLAITHCWNVQQGCMAQWMDDDSILYNDFRDGRYCAVILNIKNKTEKIIDMPVYAVSSDKKVALSLDFARLHRLRPGYGYANLPDNSKNQLCPNEYCIWRINLEDGEVVPLLKYSDFANFEPREEMKDAEHKVNHLMISPDGTRFMVLHRWFKSKTKYTRLVTCNIDGTNMYNLSDDDFVSHCCWKNNSEIVSYLNKKVEGKGYYLMKDGTEEYIHLWDRLVMDGHPTYSYDGKYVVTDTYPDRRRVQSLYVMKGNDVKQMARVFSPFKYGGDTRCDLHPRWSKDGKKICFDGSFKGRRGIYSLDISELYSEEETKISDNKKVSIIIPCYNCEEFIDDTLKSLLDQTYKNFEVICIDDGSSDKTLDYLNKWRDTGKLNLSIHKQQNTGVSSARNRGIKVATGEYILFLDSDDCYHDRFVELMVLGIEKADISYCKLSRKKDCTMSFLAEKDNSVYKTQSQAMHDLLYKMGEISFCNYIYKKSILEKNEILFEENTKFGEDREFNWKYLCHCNSAVFYDMPLYWYRVNNGSATKGKASWRKTDLLAAVKRIEQYLENQNCEFSKEFNSYMYSRAMWAVAKTFAISDDKSLFKKLIKEYPVRVNMKKMTRDKNKLVAISALCYMFSPYLFYSIVRIKK